MESELGELSAELLGRLLGEGDPDPLADYFGKGVGLGKPLAKHSQDFIGGERAVGLALFEVHVRPGAFAWGRWLLALAVSARLLGTEAEPRNCCSIFCLFVV